MVERVGSQILTPWSSRSDLKLRSPPHRPVHKECLNGAVTTGPRVRLTALFTVARASAGSTRPQATHVTRSIDYLARPPRSPQDARTCVGPLRIASVEFRCTGEVEELEQSKSGTRACQSVPWRANQPRPSRNLHPVAQGYRVHARSTFRLRSERSELPRQR